ncbi:MAG: hypothetical protein IKU16_00615, partial [Muribaculaceae bacterium]|nr:hypothetical protein [Muribaculaceae bacterium]
KYFNVLVFRFAQRSAVWLASPRFRFASAKLRRLFDMTKFFDEKISKKFAVFDDFCLIVCKSAE